MAADFTGRGERDREESSGDYSVPLSFDAEVSEPVRVMAQSVPTQTMSGGQPV